jgi:hypothetical protein
VKDPDEWIAASQASGLHHRRHRRRPHRARSSEGIDLTKKLGGDSMLVVARYDQKQSLVVRKLEQVPR